MDEKGGPTLKFSFGHIKFGKFENSSEIVVVPAVINTKLQYSSGTFTFEHAKRELTLKYLNVTHFANAVLKLVGVGQKSMLDKLKNCANSRNLPHNTKIVRFV